LPACSALGDDLDTGRGDRTDPLATVDVADPPLPAGVVAPSFITTAPDAMARPDQRRRPERGAAHSPRAPASDWSRRTAICGAGTVFAVAANAPTAAARRLAGRNRLADIEAELRVFRADLKARGRP
jgi:chromosome segregation protein